VEGPGRNHWGARVRGWLDERRLARANQLLKRLSDLVRAGRPGPGCQPIALAWVLAPVPSRRGLRGGRPVKPATPEANPRARTQSKNRPRGQSSARRDRS
jgi:hypothetical protein